MMVIGQRYEIERELGTGGTATVYAARDRVLSRTCAVKLLTERGQGPAAENHRARLRTEAMALATLDHPRVVRVYDLGEHEGQPFLAMEYVEGGSLADRLLARGPLPPAEAVDRMLEVLDALGAAHAAGIVHRDVKPHNVLIRGDGTAALADFGIARQEERSHTRTGVALGSVDYMAPEQRVDARGVGPSADVYGAGCTLFHLLTAETPVDLYLAPDHSPRWEGVPTPLRAVVRRATSVDPSDRYLNAAEMAADLAPRREAVAGLPPRQLLGAARTPGGAPTRDVPSEASAPRVEVVGTQERQGHVGAPEYAWATSGRRVGQSGMVIGLALMVAVAIGAFLARPVVEGVVTQAQERREGPSLPSPKLAGDWSGTFGGRHPGTLTLYGEPDLLTADLDVELDGHRLRSQLVGRYLDDGHVLALRARGTELSGEVDDRGFVTGELRVGTADPVVFVLVRGVGD